MRQFLYDSLSISWTYSHRSHAECVMCMQRNGYSFTVFFKWTRFLLIWLVPRRKGMDFYRASNSQSWERLWKALYVEDVTVLKRLTSFDNRIPIVNSITNCTAPTICQHSWRYLASAITVMPRRVFAISLDRWYDHTCIRVDSQSLWARFK
jgi:hypothetical protein